MSVNQVVVASTVDYTRGNASKWLGNVFLRRKETEAIKNMKDVYLDGKNREDDRE